MSAAFLVRPKGGGSVVARFETEVDALLFIAAAHREGRALEVIAASVHAMQAGC